MSYKLVLLYLFTIVISTSLQSQENWPNWRGPNNDGVSLNGKAPTTWSETENIKWKTTIPGKGLGTPVIWGDQVFITTAIELDQKATEEAIKRMKDSHPGYVKLFGMAGTTENFIQFKVVSVSRKTGEIIWSKVVREQYPHEGYNDQGAWVSASCVADGEHMIATFGSYGFYCFDMKGNLIWEKDLGDMRIINAFGEGSTPAIYENKLVIVWDHEDDSKIVVLDKTTGEEIWQKSRNEKSGWTSPLVIDYNGKKQIIVQGTNKSIGYDLETGEDLWGVTGLGDANICTPVFDGELAYVMTCFGKSKIVQAIDVKKAMNGEDSSAVVWSTNMNPSYIPSPIIKDGKLYFMKQSRAQITCVEAKTGKPYYQAQKPSGMSSMYASPLWVDGKIYIVGRKGNCAVIEDGEEFKVISVNKLDDGFDASPVVVGNDLFLRGYNSLYCISE